MGSLRETRLDWTLACLLQRSHKVPCSFGYGGGGWCCFEATFSIMGIVDTFGLDKRQKAIENDPFRCSENIYLQVQRNLFPIMENPLRTSNHRTLQSQLTNQPHPRDSASHMWRKAA